jgi:hypothetical protein
MYKNGTNTEGKARRIKNSKALVSNHQFVLIFQPRTSKVILPHGGQKEQK